MTVFARDRAWPAGRSMVISLRTTLRPGPRAVREANTSPLKSPRVRYARLSTASGLTGFQPPWVSLNDIARDLNETFGVTAGTSRSSGCAVLGVKKAPG